MLVEAQANGLHVVTSKTVVPWDIDVTGHASFVPLEASGAVWAEAVLKTSRETDGSSNLVVKQSYDMTLIAKELLKIYQNKVEVG